MGHHRSSGTLHSSQNFHETTRCYLIRPTITILVLLSPRYPRTTTVTHAVKGLQDSRICRKHRTSTSSLLLAGTSHCFYTSNCTRYLLGNWFPSRIKKDTETSLRTRAHTYIARQRPDSSECRMRFGSAAKKSQLSVPGVIY